MANEIKATLNVTLVNGSLKDSIQPGAIQIDQEAAGAFEDVVTVNSSAAQKLSFGSISTPGVAYFRNLDATNFASFGVESTSGALFTSNTFKPSEPNWMRLTSGTTYMAQASTSGAAAIELHVKVYEN